MMLENFVESRRIPRPIQRVLRRFTETRKAFPRRIRVIHKLAFPKEEGYVRQGGQDCAHRKTAGYSA
jgi:hypothetical protein